jgi:predicted amidohydrolase YtcJ
MHGKRPREYLLTNGHVVAVDERGTVGSAIAVRGDRIVFVGSDDGARRALTDGAVAIDLAGRTVVPGMVDAHAHMDSWWRTYPSLQDCRSIADVQEQVATHAARSAPREWLVFRQLADPDGKAPATLAEGRYPDRHDLDSVAPDNPVWIRGSYLSPSIANSAALALAGITRNPDQPARLERVFDTRTRDWIPSPGGRIEVDADGEPTGVLHDFDQLLSQPTTAAMARCLPKPSYADRLANIESAMHELSSLGITAIYEGHGVANPVALHTRAYLDIWSRGGMTLRAQIVPNLYTGGTIPEILEQFDEFAYAAFNGAGDDWLRFTGVGITLDGPGGALDSVQTKQASWPGPDDEIRDGICRVPKEKFVAIAEQAAQRGFRMSTKAGGEQMVDWVIEVYSAVDERWGIRDKRWTMFHSQFTHPRQMPKLRELGVAPATAANFMWNHGSTFREAYGSSVAERSVPFRSFLDAGLPIANESDTFPKNPLFAMWLMLTRADGTTGEPLGLTERLDRNQALEVLTRNGAYMLNMEDRIGSLEPGKYADLVVLSDDVLAAEVDPRDVAVEATMAGGRWVYAREADRWDQT